MSDLSNSFVVIMGIGTVFVGLLLLVILCKIITALCSVGKKSEETVAPKTVAPAPAEKPIENRQEIIAAVSAALAEEMGTDISAIRILSFKKI